MIIIIFTIALIINNVSDMRTQSNTNCHVLHTSKLLYIPRREQRKESIIVYALVRRKSKREGTGIED